VFLLTALFFAINFLRFLTKMEKSPAGPTGSKNVVPEVLQSWKPNKLL
jgi:hypothetical protein